MAYRYLAFLDDARRNPPAPISDRQRTSLGELGLQSRVAAPGLRLFASKQTPVLVLPYRRVLVGQLFDRSGKPIHDGSVLPSHESDSRFVQQLFRDYWGEYIVISHAEAHPKLIREPSGGMPAVYVLGEEDAGFLTSDISLAVTLDLYKRKIDWSYIDTFLTFPNLKTAATALEQVRELLPGCSVQWRSGAADRIEWSPWSFVARHRRFAAPEDAADAIRATVQSVVQALAHVDRHVLLELSGGLDSSIVAACLQGTDAHVRCCTLTTEVAGVDERHYAALMASQLGVDLELRALALDQARFDAPPPPQAVVPGMAPLQYAVDTAMSKAGTSHAVTSHFTGGGGDTVFCYLATAAPAVDAFRELGIAAALGAIRDLSLLHNCTFWKAARITAKKILRRPRPTSLADRSFLAGSSAPRIPADTHPWLEAPTDALPGDRERITDLVGTMAFRASSPRGRDTWLRMPLLSQPVLEACLRAPSWMAIEGGQNRAIARAAFTDRLPPEVLNRRSKGTFVNYSGAAYQRSKANLRQFLLSGLLRERQLLNATALERFFDQELPPRNTAFMRLFELAMIENWLRHQA